MGGARRRDALGHGRDIEARLTELDRRQTRVPPRLGRTGIEVDDWNNAIDDGWYWSTPSALNNPVGNIALGHVMHYGPDGTYHRVMQEVWFPTSSGGAAAANQRKTWRRVGSSNQSGDAWTFTDWVLDDPSAIPLSDIAMVNLGGGVDLNTLGQGLYHQAANAQAATGSNYPAALAGLLEVYVNGGMSYQRYTLYNGTGHYVRTRYQTTWYPWQFISDKISDQLRSPGAGAHYLAIGSAGNWVQSVSGTIVWQVNELGEVTQGSVPAARLTGTIAAARLPAATETAIGAVERATAAEALAGTDNTRFITAKQSFDTSPTRRGTTTQMNAATSRYWDFWHNTTDGYIYVGNSSGGWRRYSGALSDTPKAWTSTIASTAAGRTINFTVPTVLESGETLQIAMDPAYSTSGFNFIGMTGLVRNPTNTAVDVRLMQLMNSTANQGVQIVWTITPI